MTNILDKDGKIKVIGRVTGNLLDGDQVPGMPGAICHACGLGYRCMNEDCPNDITDHNWPSGFVGFNI